MILVSGANGFVGRAVVRRLLHDGHRVRGSVRSLDRVGEMAGMDLIAVGAVDGDTEWATALDGVDTVIHLVARTHVTREDVTDPLALYRQINVEGTRRLAEQAKEVGVRRLVFVSSVKVNGESTTTRPFTEADPVDPQDAYGLTKKEAEDVLVETLDGSGTGYVIVRPPLVYGAGVRANLETLMRAVWRGVPLPLAGIDNQRSMIGVSNLADVLVACAEHPNAAGRTFLVSDDADVSTPRLIAEMAGALERPVRLLPFPPAGLRMLGTVTGRRGMVEKLVGSLRVDCSRVKRELGWEPPYTFAEGIREMAESFRSDHEVAKRSASR